MDGSNLTKIVFLYVGISSVFLLSACIDKEDSDNTRILAPDDSTKTIPAETQNLKPIQSVGYIYHAENGNRLVQGQGDLPNLTPIDITLSAPVTWVAAANGNNGNNNSIWVTILENGDVKAFEVNNKNATEVNITPAYISTVIPPTLIIENDGSVKLANVFDGGSVFASPVIIDKNSGSRAYIATNGDVVLKTANTEKRLSVDALPYARLLVDNNKRILVLSGPTLRYNHLAVLGANFKHASSITLIDTDTFTVSNKIEINAPDVVEGNALIWADVNNDGTNEIITTLSNTNGARIVIFNEDGSVYSETDAIGVNQRWRHQIAVAPFKSSSETSLVSVYIPHLAPKIEYFRLDDQSMDVTDKVVSYTSHLFTGINIDMGITGDFDNDGKPELLLVNHESRFTLDPSVIGAFEYGETGIKLDWTLNLTDRITSNLAAVTLPDNTIAFGVGQGKKLRIWHP